MSVKLEGALNKWTNYYSGWQPRWFILEGGVLSYYISPSEVHKGSRGSLNVMSCSVIAHAKDLQRIDLMIRGGRQIYLRADSQAERQKWLVALITTKQQEPIIDPSYNAESTQTQSDLLKSKMVDLHTTCQLLVTHVSSLKTAAKNPSTMTDKNLDEISNTLSSTCELFLNTLAECMDLSCGDSWPNHLKPLTQQSAGSPMIAKNKIDRVSSNGFSADELYSLPPLPATPTRTIPPSSPVQLSLPAHLRPLSGEPQDSQLRSVNRAPPSEVATGERGDKKLQTQQPEPDTETMQVQEPDSTTPKYEESVDGPSNARQPSSDSRSHTRSNSDLFLTPTSSPHHSPSPSPSPVPASNKESFFSGLAHRFEDIKLEDGGNIPTLRFLHCCRDVLPFFDTLSPTAFAPVKADIGGNIDKLARKYNSNKKLYYTLQAIVTHELDTQTHTAKNSATDALLWLKRAMEFVQVFLLEVANGEQSLDIAAGKAYSKSLRQHHNWLVKGIFNLAVKAVPYHQDFLCMLGSDGTPAHNRVVLEHMNTFTLSLSRLIHTLDQFYTNNNLET